MTNVAEKRTYSTDYKNSYSNIWIEAVNLLDNDDVQLLSALLEKHNEKLIIIRRIRRLLKTYLENRKELAADQRRKIRREHISAGVARARARGVKLGNPRPNVDNARQAFSARAARFRSDVAPLIEELRQKGLSLNAIARKLNELRVPTQRGRDWHASSVRNVLLEIEAAQSEPQLDPGQPAKLSREHLPGA